MSTPVEVKPVEKVPSFREATVVVFGSMAGIFGSCIFVLFQWVNAMKLKGPIPEYLKNDPLWMLSFFGVFVGVAMTVMGGWMNSIARYYGKTDEMTSKLFFSGCGVFGVCLGYQTSFYAPPDISVFWRSIGFLLFGIFIVWLVTRKKSEKETKPRESIFANYVHDAMCSIGITAYCLFWLLAFTLVSSALRKAGVTDPTPEQEDKIISDLSIPSWIFWLQYIGPALVVWSIKTTKSLGNKWFVFIPAALSGPVILFLTFLPERISAWESWGYPGRFGKEYLGYFLLSVVFVLLLILRIYVFKNDEVKSRQFGLVSTLWLAAFAVWLWLPFSVAGSVLSFFIIYGIAAVIAAIFWKSEPKMSPKAARIREEWEKHLD